MDVIILSTFSYHFRSISTQCFVQFCVSGGVFSPSCCSGAQTQSDLSVWSMSGGFRGAQLQYWCRTLYNHPSTYLSVSFDTALTLTWAAVTPIMQQPATWASPPPHLTGSSVVFLVLSFHSETHTHVHVLADLDPQHRQEDDNIYSPLSAETDWIVCKRTCQKR